MKRLNWKATAPPPKPLVACAQNRSAKVGLFGAQLMRQKVVYWAPKPTPDLYGQSEFTSPVEIDCRCEEGNFLTVNAQGKELTATFRITSRTPMDRLGYVKLGTVAGLSSPDPKEAGAVEILQVTKAETLKVTTPIYTIMAGR